MRRALVVHDDPNVRDAVAETLRKQGFEVQAVPATPDPLPRLGGGWDTVLAGDGALAAQRSETAALRRANALSREPALVGRSAAIRSALELAQRAAQADTPVYVTGEPGSGRQSMTREIHDASRRSGQGLFFANLASLAPADAERELFGTGGLMEQAARGTLVLREIQAASPATLDRLASALESGASPRILVTSSADLHALAATGKFPAVLERKLCAQEVRVPPLRERREDIPELVDRYSRRYAAANGHAVPAFGPEATAALMAHDWPGNVQQLRNVVERVVLLGRAEAVDPVDLPPEIFTTGVGGAASYLLRPARKAFERQFILWVIRELGGDKPKAAEALGINLSSLYRKMSGEDADETGSRFLR